MGTAGALALEERTVMAFPYGGFGLAFPVSCRRLPQGQGTRCPHGFRDLSKTKQLRNKQKCCLNEPPRPEGPEGRGIRPHCE
jgi:hypothetical protein